MVSCISFQNNSICTYLRVYSAFQRFTQFVFSHLYLYLLYCAHHLKTKIVNRKSVYCNLNVSTGRKWKIFYLTKHIHFQSFKWSTLFSFCHNPIIKMVMCWNFREYFSYSHEKLIFINFYVEIEFIVYSERQLQQW